MSVEDTFDIEILYDNAETLLMVGDLIAYIKTKQKSLKDPHAYLSPGGWRRLCVKVCAACGLPTRFVVVRWGRPYPARFTV